MLARTNPFHASIGILSIVGLLLFAAAMSAPHLDGDGFWLDEWWSQYSAGAPVFGTESSLIVIWNRQAVEDPYNLPGYPWLVALWGSIVGWTEAASRVLPWMLGLLAIATVARVGADLGGVRLGIATALVASTSAWLLYYMHELRTYTLIAFLTAFLLLLYQRALRRPDQLLLHAGIALCCGGLLYSHYFATFPIVALALLHLTELTHRRPDKTWWRITLAMGAGMITLLPWLTTSLAAMQSMASQQRVTMTPERLWELTNTIIVLFSSGNPIAFVLFAALSLSHPRARRFASIAAVTLALSLLASVIFAIGEARYAYALLPLLALLGGFGIASFMRRGVPLALFAALLVANTLITANSPDLWHRMQHTPPQPFRELARHFAPLLSTNEHLVYILSSDADSRGVHEAPFHFYIDPIGASGDLSTLSHPTAEAAIAELTHVVDHESAIWVARDSRESASDSLLLDAMMATMGYLPCDAWRDHERFLTRPFAQLAVNPDEEEIVTTNSFGWTPHLASAWLSFAVPHETPPDTYSVGVHIVAEDGQLVAQSDFPLPSAGNACRLAQIPIEMLARPATYTARLVIYEWQSGDRISFMDADGNDTDEVRLGDMMLNEGMLQSPP